jgi:hypothetical protein
MSEKYNLLGIVNLVLTAHQSGISTVEIFTKASNTTDVKNLSLRERQATRAWGFTPKAEALNGRLAMLRFGVALSIELFFHQGILHFLHIL